MIEVTQTKTEAGKDAWEFTANATDYYVTAGDYGYTVYSSRKSYSGFGSINVYDTLEELAARSKAFRNLAALIAA